MSSNKENTWIELGFNLIRSVAGGLTPSKPIKDKGCNTCPDVKDAKTFKPLKIRRKRWQSS